MKICIDINSIHYTIVLHDVHLYMDTKPKKQMKYLFNINGTYSKKYLIDIDYEDFKNFIKECLEYGSNILNQTDFEISVIQVIEKYSSFQDCNLRLFLNKKLGNFLLFNPEFKNFDYLKKLEKFFAVYSELSTELNSDNLNFKQNSQIKYLLILINNLVKLKSNIIQIKRKIEPINMLDFIFDYYLN